MRWGVALLFLAGCAGPERQDFCQRVANRDPAVKALILRSVSQPSFLSQSGSELTLARANAERDCRRRQGILPPDAGVRGDPPADTLIP